MRGERRLLLTALIAAGAIFLTGAAPFEAEWGPVSAPPGVGERVTVSGSDRDSRHYSPRDSFRHHPQARGDRYLWRDRSGDRFYPPRDHFRHGRFIHRPPLHWDAHRGRFEAVPPAHRFAVCTRSGSVLICYRY